MSIETTTTHPAVDLLGWIEAHREDFRPPVSNKYMYDGQDFFVMIIAGPNARNDFHITKSEEFFYQIKGDINVRIREDGEVKDFPVKEGETFFIPSGVPHSPQRPPGTLGMVVERRRPPGEMEHLVFYCEGCGELVHDLEFDLKDIVVHFKGMMEEFWNTDDLRTCKNCGKRVEKPAAP